MLITKHYKPVDKAHRLVHNLFEIMNKNGISIPNLCPKGQRSVHIAHGWLRGSEPSLRNFDEALIQTGHCLALRYIPDFIIEPAKHRALAIHPDLEHLHWILRDFFKKQGELNISIRELAGRAGVSENIMCGWRYGITFPTLTNLEKALAVFGWQLEVQPIAYCYAELCRGNREDGRKYRESVEHFDKYALNPSEQATDHSCLLHHLVRESGMSLREIEEKSGCHRRTMKTLRLGRDVTVDKYEYLFGAIGYQLFVKQSTESAFKGIQETRFNPTISRASEKAHWLVKIFFEQLGNQEVTVKKFCEIADMHSSTIFGWKSGNLPYFEKIKHGLSLLGYGVFIRKDPSYGC